MIGVLVRFILRAWSDRSDVAHGDELQHCCFEQIVHVHKEVWQEYTTHTYDQEPFMEGHFDETVKDFHLNHTLSHMAMWLR